MAQTVICPSCGATSTNLQRCEYCGAIIPPQPVSQPTNPNANPASTNGLNIALQTFCNLCKTEVWDALLSIELGETIALHIRPMREARDENNLVFFWGGDAICQLVPLSDNISDAQANQFVSSFENLFPDSFEDNDEVYYNINDIAAAEGLLLQYIASNASVVMCKYKVAIDNGDLSNLEDYVFYDAYGNVEETGGLGMSMLNNPQLIKARQSQDVQYQAAAPEHKANIWNILGWISVALAVISFILWLFV